MPSSPSPFPEALGTLVLRGRSCPTHPHMNPSSSRQPRTSGSIDTGSCVQSPDTCSWIKDGVSAHITPPLPPPPPRSVHDTTMVSTCHVNLLFSPAAFHMHDSPRSSLPLLLRSDLLLVVLGDGLKMVPDLLPQSSRGTFTEPARLWDGPLLHPPSQEFIYLVKMFLFIRVVCASAAPQRSGKQRSEPLTVVVLQLLLTSLDSGYFSRDSLVKRKRLFCSFPGNFGGNASRFFNILYIGDRLLASMMASMLMIYKVIIIYSTSFQRESQRIPAVGFGH